MRKFLISLLLFIVLSCSQPQDPVILTQDYSFLLPEGDITKLRQSNDTLYEYKCYVDRPCHFNPETHYKILSSYNTGEFTILKLKLLDAIPLKDDVCPDKRFSILALKNINKNQLGYLHPFHCLTRKQVDTTQINNLSLNDRNVPTYFSDTYLKELSTFKKVSTINDVKEIINAIENNDYDAGKISYSPNQLNMACIKTRYDPVSAGIVIDSIYIASLK